MHLIDLETAETSVHNSQLKARSFKGRNGWRKARKPRWFVYTAQRDDKCIFGMPLLIWPQPQEKPMKIWLCKNLRASKGQERRYEYRIRNAYDEPSFFDYELTYDGQLMPKRYVEGIYFYERKDAIQFSLRWM